MLEKHLVHALIGSKDPYRCLAWLRGSLVFTPVALTPVVLTSVVLTRFALTRSHGSQLLDPWYFSVVGIFLGWDDSGLPVTPPQYGKTGSSRGEK
jgi:hypothetical protein